MHIYLERRNAQLEATIRHAVVLALYASTPHQEVRAFLQDSVELIT